MFNSTNSHFYTVVYGDISNGYTPSEAKSLAEASSYFGVKGHLVTIADSSEVLFLQNLLKDLGSYVPNGVHIGASDAAAEGVWKWTTSSTDAESGKTLFFANNSYPWVYYQPSGGTNQNYAIAFDALDNYDGMSKGTLYLDDVGASSKAGYVIEYDFAGVNITGTAKEGESLSVVLSAGTWSSIYGAQQTGKITYKWFADGVEITGDRILGFISATGRGGGE